MLTIVSYGYGYAVLGPGKEDKKYGTQVMPTDAAIIIPQNMADRQKADRQKTDRQTCRQTNRRQGLRFNCRRPAAKIKEVSIFLLLSVAGRDALTAACYY